MSLHVATRPQDRCGCPPLAEQLLAAHRDQPVPPDGSIGGGSPDRHLRDPGTDARRREALDVVRHADRMVGISTPST